MDVGDLLQEWPEALRELKKLTAPRAPSNDNVVNLPDWRPSAEDVHRWIEAFLQISDPKIRRALLVLTEAAGRLG